MADGDGYGGVVGAFPYAYRASDSWLFRSYVAVSALVGAGIAALFALGLVGVVADTAAVGGGTFSFSRAFYVVVGLLFVLPVIAPTLSVARRHRRGRGDRRYDLGLALAGYLFVVSLYVGLLVSVPPDQQTAPAGALAPIVRWLYGLPQLYGLVPPLLCAAFIFAIHRRLGR